MNNKKVYRTPWRSFPTTLNTYHSEGTLPYVSYYVNYVSGGWISKDYRITLGEVNLSKTKKSGENESHCNSTPQCTHGIVCLTFLPNSIVEKPHYRNSFQGYQFYFAAGFPPVNWTTKRTNKDSRGMMKFYF